MPVAELRIVVTGGGTGGHTIPALATVQALKKLVEAHGDLRLTFLYIGSSGGIEGRLAAEAGLPFASIPTGKLRRSSNPVRMLNAANVRDAFHVPQGFIRAISLVKRANPHVVFSTGGYVSVPAVFAAALCHVPVLMHEQTVQIGLANRWSARVASRIALSDPGSLADLPPAEQKRAFVTGNIVRPVVLYGEQARASAQFGFVASDRHLPVLYITGGAQGSQMINTAVDESLDKLLEVCRIVHQCGRQREGTPQDEARLLARAAQLPPHLRRRYYVSPYIGEEIGDLYALADLVVGRSGAGTVSEVCAVGKAALFIPLVPTGGDEQTRNAQRLVDAGAARIVPQSALSGPVLLDAIRELLADKALLQQMGLAATALAYPDAARDLATALLDMALVRAHVPARAAMVK